MGSLSQCTGKGVAKFHQHLDENNMLSRYVVCVHWNTSQEFFTHYSFVLFCFMLIKITWVTLLPTLVQSCLAIFLNPVKLLWSISVNQSYEFNYSHPKTTHSKTTPMSHGNGLVQERHNSSALAMELHFFFTNPSMYKHIYICIYIYIKSVKC